MLRTLTLCDGHQVEAETLRAVRPSCYCAQLVQAVDGGQELAASVLRSQRARAVARWERLDRTRTLRQKLEEAW